MTEAEWLTATDPGPMLEFLKGKASDRKLRLFGVACCRIQKHLLDRYSLKTLSFAERCADRGFTKQKLDAARNREREAAYALSRNSDYGPEFYATLAVSELCQEEIDKVIASTKQAAACDYKPNHPNWYPLSLSKQAPFLRDVFGNPFRPVAVDPAWLSSTAVAIAQGIYDDKAFDRLPILADALQDAGCENADLLTHLRGDGPHVRGCWALDLVLGKQ